MEAGVYTEDEKKLLSCCTLCPRECGVNRFTGGSGYCGMDAGMNIASVCIHRGEEPPISGPDGICNIFFAGCNLKCSFCQNHEISRPSGKSLIIKNSLNSILDDIEKILTAGIKAVGFVSPSHMIPQVKAIIRGLRDRGYNPATVYNTGGYDKPEMIDTLDGLIDVYLPDYKYATACIAEKYSDASDYPEIALAALKRMYYQKGSVLHTDNEGRASSGILVRHLVLPGNTGESKKVLRSIADELSPGMNISLMSQYNPVAGSGLSPLPDRPLYKSEYEMVVEVMNELGFRNGWLQEMDSYLNYRPDFRRGNPFEDKR